MSFLNFLSWISDVNFSRMRGKMRFWSKTKHSEKKLSREKQTSRSEAVETHGNDRKEYTHTHTYTQ